MLINNHTINNSSELAGNTSVVTLSGESPVSMVWFVVGVILLFLALLGNVLVLVIIYGKSSKRRKEPHEIMIAHLSFADIALVVTTVLSVVIKIPRSHLFCVIVYPLNSATLLMSMFTLAAMADLRRRILLKPFDPKPSSRSVKITVVVLWFLALLAMVPFAAVLSFTEGEPDCEEKWSSPDLNKAYTVGLSVITYVIPIAVIFVSYTRIALYLRKHMKNAKYLHLKPRREDKEFMKASLILVLLYTVLTLPLNLIWILTVVFHVQVPMSLFKHLSALVYVQSCCNPFVYGALTSRFRRGFAHYLSYCCKLWHGADLTKERQVLHYVPKEETDVTTVRLVELRTDSKRAKESLLGKPENSDV